MQEKESNCSEKVLRSRRCVRSVVFLVILLSICSAASSSELAPWFPTELEIDAQAYTQLQAYHDVNSGSSSKRKPACDLFFGLSAGSAYHDFAAELEAIATDTRYQDFGMDSIQLTGRYRRLNDIVADPVSLVLGLTVSQVFKPGLRNLSSFHHGGIECEAHLAVGKERSCEQFWVSRWWGLAGIGIADMGYPWIRANINWERNFCDVHCVRCFANTLWGLGPRRLNVDVPFKGYGAIRHQSVDVGVHYNSSYEWGGTIGIEYAYRVFACNCPAGVNQILVSVDYPFKL